jgi:hypothetical protein
LSETPDAWGDKLLQVDVYAWEAIAGSWETKPIATTDRKIWGKGKTFQLTVTLLAEPGSDRAKAFARRPALPPGRYLLKVYLNMDDWLAKDAGGDCQGGVAGRLRADDGGGGEASAEVTAKYVAATRRLAAAEPADAGEPDRIARWSPWECDRARNS